LETLAESHETRTRFRNHEWIAADMRIESTDFMVGVVGFADTEQLRDFDPQTFSWLKGEIREAFGASERTMVPFAIDLREDKRWVGFGTASRIQPAGFASGFEATLNAAIEKVGQMPTDWAVDLVQPKELVEQWLLAHPGVVKFSRTVRLHNPVSHIDDDRSEMQALAARTKTETFSAQRNRTLEIANNPLFEEKLSGIETGDLDVVLIAKEGSTEVRFSSKQHSDHTFIDDYGQDLERGMELVLRAVAEYGGGPPRQGQLQDGGDTDG
jgi:hypothetical protein